MRITESNVSLWTPLRADEPTSGERVRRVDDDFRERSTAIVAKLNVLDTDRDGWIDEDDLPYDQLVLLERQRAAEPAVDKPPQQAPPPVAAAAAPPPAEPRAPRAEPEPARAPDDAPRIDLLA